MALALVDGGILLGLLDADLHAQRDEGVGWIGIALDHHYVDLYD